MSDKLKKLISLNVQLKSIKSEIITIKSESWNDNNNLKNFTVNLEDSTVENLEKILGSDRIYPSRSEIFRSAIHNLLMYEIERAKAKTNSDILEELNGIKDVDELEEEKEITINTIVLGSDEEWIRSRSMITVEKDNEFDDIFHSKYDVNTFECLAINEELMD